MNSGGISAFAEALYGAVFEQGYHVVMLGIRGERSDAVIKPQRCTSVEEVMSAVAGLTSQEFNVYYPTTVIREDHELGSGARGTEADVDALIGLHVDIDFHGPAHPSATVSDIATALAIIDAFEVPPSLIVSTGHGVQAVWLFKEPLTIENDADRRRAKLLVRRFVATIAALGRMMGGHAIDATGDLTRVLRVPGTMNCKVKDGAVLPPVPARLLRPDDSLDGDLPCYNPDDLEPLLVGLAEDDAEIDYSLVGTFKLDSSAVAPPIVEKLCQRHPSFAQLWNNDSTAKLHDHSTSGYRYAIMGYLVLAHAADQEIADTICAWYARHDPNYDKHLCRPELILHEIAKQRSRRKRADGDQEPVNDVVLKGPAGIEFLVIQATHTGRRWNVRFGVRVNGVDTQMEVSATDTGSGKKGAVKQLWDALEGTEVEKAHLDQHCAAIDRWVKTCLTTKTLTEIEKQLRQRRTATEPTLRTDAPAMYDIALAFARESLGLAFVEPDGSIWSETLGRSLNRGDFREHIDPELRIRIQRATDFAEPSNRDPSKDIRHLHYIQKVVWTRLISTLPSEVHAQGLGPSSKAAARFRDQVLNLWRISETWLKEEGPAKGQSRVERMSLASRAKALADRHEPLRAPRWDRVQASVAAYYRVEHERSGAPVVWLAMRASMCDGQIKGIKIPVGSQSDFATLMTRYGLCDNGKVTDRVRENARGRERLCVLNRELCDLLLYDLEPDEKGGGPADEDALDQGGDEDAAFDMTTGEVVSHG